jgi:hypothetical protein
MRALNDPPKILKAAEQVRASGGKTREKGHRELMLRIHDHATPVSGGVLTGAFTEVAWLFPYWAYASEFTKRPCFYAQVPDAKDSYGTYRLLHDQTEDGGETLPTYSTLPWGETAALGPKKLKGMSHKRSFKLTYMRTFPEGGLPRNDGRWAELLKVVPVGPFVLDIDIDYFMSIDSSSGFDRKRGPKKEGTGARRRQSADDVYEEKLRKAHKLLDERLAAFQTLLERLRDAGRIPSLVTIADSTYAPFAVTIAGKNYWEYTPYEFAGYLHGKVRRLLARVYKKQGVEPTI